MRRVEDVLDVWFDSGSMSFAQVHYPFENADWFEHHFPGDFIVEYIGQTRGWFYTLHVLATALFDRPAFSSCVSHGIVLGSDGQKMSKSLRNYPDVPEVFDRDGADAMRWFLMLARSCAAATSSSPSRASATACARCSSRCGTPGTSSPLRQRRGRRRGLRAKWSTASTDVLDRYLLAKLREFVEQAQGQLDVYDIAGACDSTRGFLDVLTNWYIRRSGTGSGTPRAPTTSVSEAAFDTLYTALEVVCRVAAPLLPLTTEEIWRGLTGGRSVHLADWPEASDLPADHALVGGHGPRARHLLDRLVAAQGQQPSGALPLSDLTVVAEDAASLKAFGAIIADEVNVRTVTLATSPTASQADFGVSQRLTVNARAAGPRLGRDVQQAIKGSKTGDWSVAEDGTVTSGGLALRRGRVHPRDGRRRGGSRGSAPRRCCPVAGSSCSTPRSRPSSPKRGWPATSSVPCSRPVATPASTSATGSKLKNGDGRPPPPPPPTAAPQHPRRPGGPKAPSPSPPTLPAGGGGGGGGKQPAPNVAGGGGTPPPPPSADTGGAPGGGGGTPGAPSRRGRAPRGPSRRATTAGGRPASPPPGGGVSPWAWKWWTPDVPRPRSARSHARRHRGWRGRRSRDLRHAGRCFRPVEGSMSCPATTATASGHAS